MVRLLGAARFHFVDWPEGIEDANDMLLKDGARDRLQAVMNGTQPWPIQGLDRLSERPDPPQLVLWNSWLCRMGKQGPAGATNA